MVNEAEAGSAGVDVTSPEVTPAEVADEGRENETACEDEGAVPPVLPPNDLVPAQVTNVGDTGLAAGLDEHPANVGPPEALVRVVRVEVGVGVTVVGTVAAGPPLDGALDRACASHREEVLEWLRRVV